LIGLAIFAYATKKSESTKKIAAKKNSSFESGT
jgi:hypothetical protein